MHILSLDCEKNFEMTQFCMDSRANSYKYQMKEEAGCSGDGVW